MKCIKPIIFTMFIILSMNEASYAQEEPSSDVTPMEKQELEALYSTIQGFVGDSWNGSSLYPDPCGWSPIQGVSCDIFNGFWYVTVLNIGPIHDNSLTCSDEKLEFRPELFNLKHLKVLTFFNCFQSPNSLPVSIPTGNWEKLRENLESIEFRSNPGLVGSIPSSFGVLRNLQSMILLENGLSGRIPQEIGNLVKLKRLVLSGNNFSGNVPDNFGGLRDLLILDLSRNSLSGTLPLTFGGLISVLKIDVSHNFLEGKLLNEFSRLKNLTLLDLRNNRFCCGLVNSLQEMNSLEELVLSNNQLGGDMRNLRWENLKNLVILELSNMGLRGEIPESLFELKRLRFLGLNDNNLTGKVSPKLESLPSLNALYLSGNNLKGEIQFSKGFFGKLGRRFGAWSNPKLCVPVGVMSSDNVPFGVKPCHEQEEEVHLVKADTRKEILNGDMNMKNNTSMGLSSYANCGLWWIFMILGLVLNCYIVF
ncbi:piriformospora indica-insensitive protein 2-like [Vicia villosa]|uniref:piriformospora indica-insensitive protein 2-like n=1 Tax=Vicia villosa TaxID=3911 RepID=UPI00273CEE20|nr:piriformospora indica-insensitive protein 2-like [Vicia villosa]